MCPEQMMSAERQALENLLKHAQADTHQSRRVTDFLLAWWNPAACGSYDLTTAWSVDDDIMEACASCSGSRHVRTAIQIRWQPSALLTALASARAGMSKTLSLLATGEKTK